MEVAAFFLFSFGCFVTMFFVHALLLRFRPESGLLTSSIVTSIGVVATYGALAAAERFPVPFDLTLYGSTTAFFAYQLFFFLGPATADRSLTAHLLLYLRDEGRRGVSIEQVLEQHAPEEFIDKRFGECAGASLIRRQGTRIDLTRQGLVLAWIYARLLDAYRLRRRSHWHDSFKRTC